VAERPLLQSYYIGGLQTIIKVTGSSEKRHGGFMQQQVDCRAVQFSPR